MHTRIEKAVAILLVVAIISLLYIIIFRAPIATENKKTVSSDNLETLILEAKSRKVNHESQQAVLEDLQKRYGVTCRIALSQGECSRGLKILIDNPDIAESIRQIVDRGVRVDISWWQSKTYVNEYGDIQIFYNSSPEEIKRFLKFK